MAMPREQSPRTEHGRRSHEHEPWCFVTRRASPTPLAARRYRAPPAPIQVSEAVVGPESWTKMLPNPDLDAMSRVRIR